jgi:hypothetical protein
MDVAPLHDGEERFVQLRESQFHAAKQVLLTLNNENARLREMRKGDAIAMNKLLDEVEQMRTGKNIPVKSLALALPEGAGLKQIEEDYNNRQSRFRKLYPDFDMQACGTTKKMSKTRDIKK